MQCVEIEIVYYHIAASGWIITGNRIQYTIHRIKRIRKVSINNVRSLSLVNNVSTIYTLYTWEVKQNDKEYEICSI